MIKTVQIQTITRYTQNKEGKAYLTKMGKPFERVALMANLDGTTTYIAGVDFDGWTKGWQEGQELELSLEEKEWQGKKSLEFNKPSETAKLEERVAKLERLVANLTAKGPTVLTAKAPIEETMNLDGLPF